MREAIEQVHRQYRRDLVPYRPPQPPHRRRTELDASDGLQPADGQGAGGGRRRAGARAPARQPRDLPRAPAARAARPGALRRLAGPARRGRAEARRAPVGDRRRQQPAAGLERARAASSTTPTRERARLEDDYVSTEHLFLALEPVPREEILAWIKKVRGGQRVTSQDPEGSYQALAKFGRDLTEAAEAGQARPGDRPRRGDPARDPDPLAPDEEQPGADRRARRRQDGDRRGARAADRRRRRARGAEGPPRLGARHRLAARRLEVPRRVRGAAEGGPDRDHARATGGVDPLHRRAAHDRRRRRRRGRRRRGEPAQADARPRRAALHRRDDARRVPQAHREGRRARAALRARARRRAVGRGHDRDPARAQGALRGPPRRPHPRRGARRRGGALAALHRRPLPARQGDRPRRRGRLAAADGDRLLADRARRGQPARDAARDRAGRDGEGVAAGARADRARARRGQGGARRARRPLGEARRRRSRRSRRRPGGSTSCGWRPSAPSATATSSASPRSATARSPRSSASSPSGSGPENPMVKEEVDEDDIAAVVARWTGSRSTACSRARPRS